MTFEVDLVAYLTSKGSKTFRANGSEITTHCLFCSDGDTKGKGKLYLNTESWLYECKRCLASGNRKTLLEFFGDEDEIKHPEAADPNLRWRILEEATEFAHQMLLANEQKLDYLLKRGISPELIVARRLGYVPKNYGLSDSLPVRDVLKGFTALVACGLVLPSGKEFFNDAITIPYISHGTVVQLRARNFGEDRPKYLTMGGDQVHLYNGDSLNGATRALIIEGEFDDLAVLSQMEGSNDRWFEDIAVVGLAGASSWPAGFVDTLKGLSKVWIGLDNDETGQRAAAKLKEEVGTKARNVLLPAGLPKTDWTDFFLPRTPSNPNGGHDWRDLKSLLIEADLAGKQMFGIADLSTKWNRRQNEAPGLKLGWPSLDAVLRPGLKPGQVMIPLATTGTGKTVFLSNVAHNLRKRHVLFVSLEMTGPEVFEHIRRIHRFWNPKAGRDQLIEDYPYLQVTERNRIGRGDLGELISEYGELYSRKPDLVIVDYLQYYARGFRGNSMYDRVSEAIMEVKAVSKEESVSTIIPSQVNRGAERGKPLSLDDARDAGTIEETGDFVMSLFRPDQVAVAGDDTGGEALAQLGSFNVQFLKSRHGGVGRLANLRLSNLSLAIVDQAFDKPNLLRVENENRLARQGTHYDDYRVELNKEMSQDPLWKDS